MFESPTPCLHAPSSLFAFVANFQCYEFVLENKWKQDSLHFFSRIICGSLGVIGPSEMVLSETQQFLTITSLVSCHYQKGLERGILPWSKNNKINEMNMCSMAAQMRAWTMFSLYFLSRWSLEYSSNHFFCCMLISVLCKALPTGKHILCTRDWVSHCFPAH